MVEKVFNELISEAKTAILEDEVPVCAAIVKNNKIICITHNTKESNNDVTCHAEINAIRYCEKKYNNWRLNDCDIYVLLEPCAMCASAIKQARIRNLYYFLENSDPNVKFINNMILSNNDNNPSINYIFVDKYIYQVKDIINEYFMLKR